MDDDAREITKQAILEVLSDRKAHRSSEITEGLNKPGRERRFSKNTIYKYRAELIEDGLVDVLIGSPRDPRPRYKITEKGMKHYQKTAMISDHLKELRSLSRDELIAKIERDRLLRRVESKLGFRSETLLRAILNDPQFQRLVAEALAKGAMGEGEIRELVRRYGGHAHEKQRRDSS